MAATDRAAGGHHSILLVKAMAIPVAEHIKAGCEAVVINLPGPGLRLILTGKSAGLLCARGRLLQGRIQHAEAKCPRNDQCDVQEALAGLPRRPPHPFPPKSRSRSGEPGRGGSPAFTNSRRSDSAVQRCAVGKDAQRSECGLHIFQPWPEPCPGLAQRRKANLLLKPVCPQSRAELPCADFAGPPSSRALLQPPGTRKAAG
jgi:hypothetical protein